jgi:hypothetical protein
MDIRRKLIWKDLFKSKYFEADSKCVGGGELKKLV